MAPTIERKIEHRSGFAQDTFKCDLEFAKCNKLALTILLTAKHQSLTAMAL